MDTSAIGQHLAALRKEKRWTQKELAQRLYISPQAISKWERGKNLPDLHQLLVLCELFSCSLDALLLRTPTA